MKLAVSLAAALLMQACGSPTAEEPSPLTTSAAALTSAVSRGCTFSISYREIITPYYAYVPSVTRHASSTCAWSGSSVDLPETYSRPTLSMAANDLGVAVSYSDKYSPSGSSGMVLSLFNLAPDTLAVVRETELRAYYSYRTGIVSSGELSILADGTTLKVQGSKDGTIPGEVGTGSYYTALYPNFFTSTTAPTVTAAATAEQTQTGSWAASGNLTTARSGHTATLLSSGEVLVVGDSTAELFNPYGNTSRVSSGSFLARTQHTATRLSSGQVLVTGGWSGLAPLYWRRTAELYDTATDSFVVADAMSTPRGNHTATLLDSGKVLVTGGNTTTGETDTAELYDPATHTWSSAGSMGARAFHTATRLYSGQVLVTGGRTASGGALTDARLYDPATNNWTPVPGMGRARSGHFAIRLYSGTVMLVGGGYDEVDMYDPYNNRWYWNTLLGNGRNAVSATLLYSGEVLVTLSDGRAAIYSPSTESWRYAGALSAPLTGHTATLLDSGNVLVTGGSAGSTASSTVQRYTR
jgi:hypothetical protein